MNTSATRPSLLVRAFRRLRHKLYGYRTGLGLPVPVSALDKEYASGAWDHFWGPDELARHEVLLTLILESGLEPIRLLDVGCGSGRLASMVPQPMLRDYLGADLSQEGLKRARGLGLPDARFEQHDFEKWTPSQGAFNIITFNECLGYAADPLKTATRFASTLDAGGMIVISHHQYGNHQEFWRRLASSFDFIKERTAKNPKGQVWDLKVLRYRASKGD